MNRRNWMILACVVAMAGGLGACDTKKVFGCMPATDPWMKPPGQREAINDLSLKSNTPFAPVDPAKFDRAVGILKKAPFVVLSAKGLEDLGVTVPAGTDGLKPYLMRAVSSRQATGQYFAIYLDNNVWIRYQRSDSDTCAPLFHETAIVWLPKAPVLLFATSSIAQ